MNPAPRSVEAYLADFPPETLALLEQVRATIREIVPEAEECINYGIPTFKLHGNLVHYAGYKQHIGFYPGAAGIASFQEALAPYPTSKGTVQFALDQPIPLELIREIVAFRLAQNIEKASAKKKPASKNKEV